MRNVCVGLVDGDNVVVGNGYVIFCMVNNNGQFEDGSYGINIFVDCVILCGGGCGIFCVLQFGGVDIGNIDFVNNGNNVILIENCYGVRIFGGSVNGGGEVWFVVCVEFFNNCDIFIVV